MKIINGRQFWGQQYGDGPASQEDATPAVVPVVQAPPVRPGLVLRYEAARVEGVWECDCQVHGTPDQADLNQAFAIIQASAAKHLVAPGAIETTTQE